MTLSEIIFNLEFPFGVKHLLLLRNYIYRCCCCFLFSEPLPLNEIYLLHVFLLF